MFTYSALSLNFALWLAPLFAFVGAAFFVFTLLKAKVPTLRLVVAMAPLWFLVGLSLLSLRSFEGALAAGSLVWTAPSARWTLVIFFGGFALLFGLAGWLGFSTHPWAGELSLASLFVLWAWGLALQVRNVYLYLLILEVQGVLLALLLVAQKLATPTPSHLEGNFRPSPRDEGASLALVQAVILFLWVGVIALIAVLWAAALGIDTLGILDYSTLGLSLSFEPSLVLTRSGARLITLLLGFGLGVKLMAAPWQALLGALYQGLPLPAFLLYMVVYYLGFLATALPLLVSPLTPFIAMWTTLFLASLTVSILALAPLAPKAYDLRVLLSVSSVLSVTFLFVLALSVL